MEILFNPKAGEIYSLFTSLYFGWNINLLENDLKNLGISINNEIKEQYYNINEIQKIKKEQMDFFFSAECEVFRFFIVFPKIWESKSLEEYLAFVETMSNSSLKEMLVKVLIDNKLKNDDEHIKSIANSDEKILSFIKELDINKSSKWDLYCFINNIEKYRNEFIGLIKNYIPTFDKLFNNNIKLINDINDNILENINLKGLEFVKEYTNNLINLMILKNYT